MQPRKQTRAPSRGDKSRGKPKGAKMTAKQRLEAEEINKNAIDLEDGNPIPPK